MKKQYQDLQLELILFSGNIATDILSLSENQKDDDDYDIFG